MNSKRVCLVCNHENRPDAARCTECGAPLKVAETLLFRKTTQGDTYEAYRNQDVEVAPGHIALHFVGSVRPLHVKVEDKITLGRLIPGEPAPTIDLTDQRAGLLGVSRHHAVIYASRRGYAIEDVGSANGTWLNESQLMAHMLYDLHNRDQVRLGDLVFFVFFAD